MLIGLDSKMAAITMAKVGMCSNIKCIMVLLIF